ncbi:GNAT family N-acetyltransferase [Pelagibius sp. Alg239-R121]|uniref:GNAT family N-acetyltransferase n=1 Tax=Pelagibius sp. Alg239-R121 TaxID=2993448 RepID=UPI0024A73971|nr:GNAT family N-acetyltransferase [Pelagibius sp. Alg239-R121]
MRSGNVFGHRADSGEIVSSAAVIPYGDSGSVQSAALGMVIVDSKARRRGLGEALVREAIRWASNSQPPVPLSLIATLIGLPLYEKLGFRTVETLHKFVAPTNVPTSAVTSHANDRRLAPLDERLTNTVIDLDAAAFGYRRDCLLGHRIDQAKTGCVLFEGAAATGYGLLVRQGELAVLGPIIAPNDDAALAIVAALTANSDGPFRIDLPARQKSLFPVLESLGFEEDDKPPIMLRGVKETAARPKHYYAIAAQAFA